MKTNLLFAAAFLLGATAVLWMGLSFIGSDILALSVTVIIGFVYVLGIMELLRFRQATATLTYALRSPPTAAAGETSALRDWLAGLHPSLQNAVAIRIEGERVGLPAPVFTPYLVGLLVMLGLLGTFVGMVVTLQGAVTALEGSNELEAIRAGLAAPIRGLGLAFGTSVAGVAASAMLGLNSTLSRRERMLVTRELDRAISTVFREHSLNYNRQQTFQAMQDQAHALPEVASQLSSMAGELERMGSQLSEKLLASQDQFHNSTKELYTGLATSVGQSLKDSLVESGRLAGDSIAPIVSKAMDSITAASQDTHQQLSAASQSQLEAITNQLSITSAEITSQFSKTSTEIGSQLNQTSTDIGSHLSKTSTDIGSQLSKTSTDIGSQLSKISTDVGSQLTTASTDISSSLDSSLSGFNERFTSVSADMLQNFEQATGEWVQRQGESQQVLQGALQESAKDLAANASATSAGMVEKIGKLLAASEALVEARTTNESNWLEQHGSRMESLTSALKEELGALRNEEELRAQAAADRLASLETSSVERISGLETSSMERLGSLETSSVERMSSLESSSVERMSSLESSSAERLSSLEATAAEHLAGLGRELEQPMIRLIETASETPRAAAEVIGKLREEMTNNLARDNELLEDRQRIMQDLATMSAAMQESSTGQRDAIDKLVNASSTTLQEVSSQFSEHLATESNRLSDVATNVTGSAAELASLGEAFGLAIQLFSDSNNQLIENLSRIEESMDTSTTRSDEQMSYYVAQAREIIDQSMLSQREIIEELRQLGQNGELFTEEAS